MRIFGCCLIASAFLLVALIRTRTESMCIAALSSFADMLELMSGELTARALPLYELMKYLSTHCEGQASLFAWRVAESFDLLGRKDFSDIWAEAALDVGSIGKYEKEELIRAGTLLGRCEIEAQTRGLKRTEELLRRRCEEKLREFPSKRKLDFSLCGSAGLVMLIMLV